MALPKPVEGSFLSHANYLDSFQTIIESNYCQSYPITREIDILRGLKKTITNSGALNGIARRTDTDLQALRDCLTNSWATELLLNVTSDVAPEEILGLAN